MGFNNYSNQNRNSLRLQARSKFNNTLSLISNKLSNEYVDFICSIYSELDNQILGEDSVFTLACKEFKELIYKTSLSNSSLMLSDALAEEEPNIEALCNSIICSTFNFYCEVILDSYKTISYTFLGRKIQELLDDFSSTEVFLELRFIDFNYLKSSVHRLKTLNVRLCEQHEYIYSMFQDEYMPSIVYNLKDYVIPIFSDSLGFISNQLNTLGMDNSKVLALIETIKNDYSSFSERYLSYQDEVEEKEILKECNSNNDKQSPRIDYIDDYRRLSKMAIDSGYSLIRSNGDHGIFRNIDGDVVVIPQGRRIGKGLSLKIQKIILNAV